MGNPHVLVIPYPVQGHVLPLMELAQCLAKNGFKVTFVNTELTHKHIMSGLGGRDVFGGKVHLVSIPDGIEPGENRNIPGKLSEAISRVMPGKIEELIKEINNNNSEDGKISCVIVDQSLGWALQVAAKLGLKKAAFIPAAAGILSEAISRVMLGKIEEVIKELNDNNSEDGKISCVIVDQSLGWALQVAAKMELMKASFVHVAP